MENSQTITIKEKVQITIPGLFKISEQQNAERYAAMGLETPMEYVHEEQQTVQFWLLLSEVDFAKGSLTKTLQDNYHALARLVPGFEGFGTLTQKTEGAEVGIIQYKSNALETDLFNIMAICSISGKQFAFTCSCDYEDFETWQPIFIEAIESITDLSK